MEIGLLWASLVFSFAALCMGVAVLVRNHIDRRESEDLMMELLQQELSDQREEGLRRNSETRREIVGALRQTTQSLTESLNAIGTLQAERLDSMDRRSSELAAAVDRRSQNLQENLSGHLSLTAAAVESLKNVLKKDAEGLQTMLQASLEGIRATVDEKLTSTLEKRLGTSFELVSRQLEAVQRGLGEMQTLAGSVGDLKKVLTNVKTRGTWGEVQLGALLEQILSPEQYSCNVAVRPDRPERVEFAVKLPGENPQQRPLWLPIDSKFPLEDYQRLCDAVEADDDAGMQTARTALFRRLDAEAKDVRDKYVDPPYSTDFGVVFLPIEGLYAEILRDPEAVEKLQRQYRVVIAGPSTLAALLTSLRMGFRALAIQRRSGEVWQMLGTLRTEFGKFGAALEKARRQLAAAEASIDETGRRTQAMERRLSAMEHLDIKTLSEVPVTDEREPKENKGISQEQSESTEV